jgi:hypothetical protein
MDPVFTLQWPEFLLANRLQRLFPKGQGYSVMIPTSRQEKGIDLALLKKSGTRSTRAITFQVKASRTYASEEPKRPDVRRYKNRTWFGRFDAAREADFFLLVGLYAPDQGRTERINSSWYKDCTLLFTNEEMREFMRCCRTVSGKLDGMFGFGFDTHSAVFQTRGDSKRRGLDYSDHLLDRRAGMLREALGCAPLATV